MKTAWKHRAAALAALMIALLLVPASFAQDRMSDHDIENVMKNLKEDSKRFQSAFNSSIGHSTIRKTSQEKDAKGTVQTFRNQTEHMLDVFQDKHKADDTLPLVMATAKQVDGILGTVQLNGATMSTWAKCKSELHILGVQFNLPGY